MSLTCLLLALSLQRYFKKFWDALRCMLLNIHGVCAVNSGCFMKQRNHKKWFFPKPDCMHPLSVRVDKSILEIMYVKPWEWFAEWSCKFAASLCIELEHYLGDCTRAVCYRPKHSICRAKTACKGLLMGVLLFLSQKKEMWEKSCDDERLFWCIFLVFEKESIQTWGLDYFILATLIISISFV